MSRPEMRERPRVRLPSWQVFWIAGFAASAAGLAVSLAHPGPGWREVLYGVAVLEAVLVASLAFRLAAWTARAARGPRFLRVRHRRLSTSVLTFRRQDGRAITLIGTCHVGEPAYYKALHTLAVTLENAGALVFREAVSPVAGEALSAAPDGERAVAEALMALADDTRDQEVLDYLGWVPQKDGLPWEPSWRAADASVLDVSRGLGHDDADRIRENLRQEQDSAAVTAVRMGAGIRLAAAFPGIARGRTALELAVLDNREQALMAAMPPGYDVVLLWGANHLHGLGQAVLRDGYQLAGQEWLPVGRLPGMAETIWTLARAARLRHR